MSANEADLLRATHALGQLELHLTFQLPQSGDGFCQDDAVQARYVSAELVEERSDVSRCQTQTAEYVAHQVRYGAGDRDDPGAPRPVVQVTSLEGEGLATGELEAMRQWIEVEMVPCYVSGLVGNASLQGALVIEIRWTQTDSAGKPTC